MQTQQRPQVHLQQAPSGDVADGAEDGGIPVGTDASVEGKFRSGIRIAFLQAAATVDDGESDVVARRPHLDLGQAGPLAAEVPLSALFFGC